MTTHNTTPEEIEQFFTRLRAKLPKPEIFTPPPPSPEMLDLAWEAAKTYREYLFEAGLYQEDLQLPLAAADNADVPFKLTSIGGEWSVTRARIPGDLDWQIIKWRCRDEYLDLYEGRQVIAKIGGQDFDLGEVLNGIAQSQIPTSLDLKTQVITIKIQAKSEN